MFETILVAVDRSARAPAVLKTALAVAEKFGSTVHLFRVLTLPPDFPAAARNAPDEFEAEMVARAKEDLASLAPGHPRVVIESPVASTQEPWRAILEAARRIDAGLIVIGSHGYGGWDRILGTTAGKVTNHADRDVMVVHQPELERR